MKVNYKIDIDLDEEEIKRIIASYFSEKTGHKNISADDVKLHVSPSRSLNDPKMHYISGNVRCNCSVEV